jgi:hypothetical protein
MRINESITIDNNRAIKFMNNDNDKKDNSLNLLDYSQLKKKEKEKEKDKDKDINEWSQKTERVNRILKENDEELKKDQTIIFNKTKKSISLNKKIFKKIKMIKGENEEENSNSGYQNVSNNQQVRSNLSNACSNNQTINIIGVSQNPTLKYKKPTTTIDNKSTKKFTFENIFSKKSPTHATSQIDIGNNSNHNSSLPNNSIISQAYINSKPVINENLNSNVINVSNINNFNFNNTKGVNLSNIGNVNLNNPGNHNINININNFNFNNFNPTNSNRNKSTNRNFIYIKIRKKHRIQ